MSLPPTSEKASEQANSPVLQPYHISTSTYMSQMRQHTQTMLDAVGTTPTASLAEQLSDPDVPLLEERPEFVWPNPEPATHIQARQRELSSKPRPALAILLGTALSSTSTIESIESDESLELVRVKPRLQRTPLSIHYVKDVKRQWATIREDLSLPFRRHLCAHQAAQSELRNLERAIRRARLHEMATAGPWTKLYVRATNHLDAQRQSRRERHSLKKCAKRLGKLYVAAQQSRVKAMVGTVFADIREEILLGDEDLGRALNRQAVRCILLDKELHLALGL